MKLVDASGLCNGIHGLLDVGKSIQDFDFYPIAMRSFLSDRLVTKVCALEIMTVNELESFRAEFSLQGEQFIV